MKLICSFSIRNLAKKQCSYQDFLQRGPQTQTQTHREAKRGSRGRKARQVYEYILQNDRASERIISHMNICRSPHFMDAADWVFRKVTITS